MSAERSATQRPTRSWQTPARSAAVVSALALFSLEGLAALERIIATRLLESALAEALAVALPYLVVAALPRPRTPRTGRWTGLLFIAVACLGPLLALSSMTGGFRGMKPALPLVVLCQVVMIAGGVEILRRTRARSARARFGELFWALVLTALTPSGLLFGVMLVVRGHAPRHESVAISDLRTIVSAEAAFFSASGFYGMPRCLSSPGDCIDGYPSSAPHFADADVLELARRGYLRTFHPKPATAPHAPVAGALDGYAVIAVPLEPGKTAIASFCADDSGRICLFRTGGVPRLEGGSCPSDCEPLQ